MINNDKKSWYLLINGLVQSVGFRPFVKNLADSFGLPGYVLNNGTTGVEIVVKSSKNELDHFLQDLHQKAPKLVEIHNIEIQEIDKVKLKSNEFEIRKSNDVQTNQGNIVALPPDLAICSSCQEDLRSQGVRFKYPFTSCTNCGPRYCVIEKLPYDRENTTFKNFPLCENCLIEYTTSTDRRFHAQTTGCNNCGPEYKLFKINSSEVIEIPFDWKFISYSLRNGQMFAIKGQGGTHFVCDAQNRESVDRLREFRRRNSNKPFAVMMSSLGIISKYCKLNPVEKEIITSPRRPIVVIETKEPDIWEGISPNLLNLGVMLPFSGFHITLFDQQYTPEVLVYTSANYPNLPMPISNEEIIAQTKDIADFVLIHNRNIHQRIDDSVLRSHRNRYFIIRRSRGYVPSPFYFEQLKGSPSTIAFGAEEENTCAISKQGWIISTQHIGHIENHETLQFQKNSINHLLNLFKVDPNYLITDLHPEFLSRINIENFSTSKTQLFEIQHHVGHVASLALDNNILFEEPVLAWASDGYGYGPDGNAWGNELILLDDKEWVRHGTMSPVSYFGGDINAKYPARLVANYLIELDIDPLTYFEGKYHLFKHGKRELAALIKRPKQNMYTTSLGRFLDSVAILLGIVDRRTYRGEPAIVLEQFGFNGSQICEPAPFITKSHGIHQLDSIELFKTVLNWLREGKKLKDISWMVHQNIALSLVEIGRFIAEEEGINHLGWTGGVAYNKLITNRFEEECVNNGLDFLHHKNIPPGDAGLSSGQIYYTGRMIHE